MSEGQHTYEINLKQGDLFINLSSDDIYFISRQMDQWFKILLDDRYTPINIVPSKTSPMPTVAAPQPPHSAPQQAPPQPVYAAHPQQGIPQPMYYQPVMVPGPQPGEYYQYPPQYAVPQQQPMAPMQHAPAQHPPMHPVQPQPSPYPQVLQDVLQSPAASHQQQPTPPPQAPPAPIFQAEPQSAHPQPETPQVALPERPPLPPLPEIPDTLDETVLDQNVKDEFETVMDSLMKEFGDDANPNAPDTAPNGNGNGNGKAETPTSLSELCDRSSAGSSEDYLLLSAYFLTRFESQEKFSLKKVNSILVKSGLTPVNHSVLETTLGRGYLSMVPDMTGTAEVSEYTLTEEGQDAANRLL